MSETSVGSHLEQSFDIFSEFGLEDVRGHLKIFAFLVISLSVKEPTGNSVSFRFGNNFGDGISLLFSEFSGSKFGVDSEDFADVEAKTSSNSLDFIEGVRYSSLTIDVGVENTVNMLEVVFCVFDNQRHLGCG